jgi:hypothetical protein
LPNGVVTLIEEVKVGEIYSTTDASLDGTRQKDLAFIVISRRKKSRKKAAQRTKSRQTVKTYPINGFSITE